MDKRLFFIFIGIFLCLHFSFSESLKQYQTFSWKKVSKAKKYEIIIEKEVSEGTYEQHISKQLKENTVELLLYPGNYRVAVSVFNALGKKASTTDWTNFIILNETEPYLYPNFFVQSARWKSPVIKVHGEGTQTVEEEDDEGVISARSGDPTNSFPVKGKNIFFEKTSFRLVPKIETESGVEFVSFFDNKPEVPLTIVRRDTEKGEVIVKYNEKNLFSGYYDLVVENPGEHKTSMEILVLSNESPKIDSSIYEYDKNYKVNVLTVQKGQPFNLCVRGTGFDGSTVYSFTPDKGIIPYPFASEFDLESVPVSLDSYKTLNTNGTLELNLILETDKLQTGYYKLEAQNGFLGTDSQLFLVKTISAPDKKPELSKFKTKASDTEITYRISGKKIEKGAKFTLIAPYSEENDGNKRIKLSYIESKMIRTLHILQSDRQSIVPGRYAVYVESKMGSSIVYVDVDENYLITKAETNEEEMASLFLRPENKPVVVEVKDKVIESHFLTGAEKKKYIGSMRWILPSMRVGPVFQLFNYNVGSNGTKNGSNRFVCGVEARLDLLYLKFLRLDVGFNYKSNPQTLTIFPQFGGDLYFEIPWNNFKPFTGAGLYYIPSMYNEFTDTKGAFSIPIEIGFFITDYFRFSYSVCLEGINTAKPFATDEFHVGIQIPLGQKTYKSTVKETYADIAHNVVINGTEYELDNTMTSLILDSREILGFEGLETIKSVRLSENVRTIGSAAFANMKNLSSISIYEGLNSIKNNAFVNDTKIAQINIPRSVLLIEEGAFDGWTSKQAIKLMWNSDDETPRDLSGLKTTGAKVLFLDGIERKVLEGENE
ncbi:MAG: leucine-rich repeat domain-containing protein [Treponema sp.]|nr:leucine-rich repeat domain-containing protein [Candidatus Treponema merdequi]